MNNDEFCTYGRNVLTTKEIIDAGFYFTNVPANITSDKRPYITLTYNLGVYPNRNYMYIPILWKHNIIKKIRYLGITHVHRVYFGEIFINPDYNLLDIKNRWNNIFVRGWIDREVNYNLFDKLHKAASEDLLRMVEAEMVNSFK